MEKKFKQIIFLLFLWFLFLLKAVKIQFTWWRSSTKLALSLRSNEQNPLHTYLTSGPIVRIWREEVEDRDVFFLRHTILLFFGLGGVDDGSSDLSHGSTHNPFPS
jgi:hypothetical protein